MGKLYLILALLIVSFVFIAETRIVTAEPLWAFGKRTEREAPKNQPSGIVKNTSLGALTTGDAEIDGYIVESCQRHDIDPLLIYAQMKQESGFKQKAVSHKGASGLMQLIPATARRFGVENIYDPQQNIEAGVKYMRWLLNKFDGNTRLALAAYNAGEGAVMKYGNQIPPYRETQTYVARITSHYLQIKTPDIARPIVNPQTARAN